MAACGSGGSSNVRPTAGALRRTRAVARRRALRHMGDDHADRLGLSGWVNPLRLPPEAAIDRTPRSTCTPAIARGVVLVGVLIVARIAAVRGSRSGRLQGYGAAVAVFAACSPGRSDASLGASTSVRHLASLLVGVRPQSTAYMDFAWRCFSLVPNTRVPDPPQPDRRLDDMRARFVASNQATRRRHQLRYPSRLGVVRFAGADGARFAPSAWTTWFRRWRSRALRCGARQRDSCGRARRQRLPLCAARHLRRARLRSRRP